VGQAQLTLLAETSQVTKAAYHLNASAKAA
jgi:hypothetical protein